MDAQDILCSGNTAEEGGCLFNAIAGTPGTAIFTINRANINNNFADVGGGVENVNGVMNISNTYLTNNKSLKPGASVASAGETTLDLSQVTSGTISTADLPVISTPEDGQPVQVFGSIISSGVNCLDNSTITNLGYNLINNADCFPDGQNNSEVQTDLPLWLTEAEMKSTSSGTPLEILSYLNISQFDDFIPPNAFAGNPAVIEDYRGVERPQGAGATPGPLESAAKVIVNKQVIDGDGSEGPFSISFLEENVPPLADPVTHKWLPNDGGSTIFRLTRNQGRDKASVTIAKDAAILVNYQVEITCDNGVNSKNNQLQLELDWDETVSCAIFNKKIDLPHIYLPMIIK